MRTATFKKPHSIIPCLSSSAAVRPHRSPPSLPFPLNPPPLPPQAPLSRGALVLAAAHPASALTRTSPNRNKSPAAAPCICQSHNRCRRFTLNVAPDASSKAAGSLYIDDGATNSHQSGLWQRAEFSWSASASGGILSFTAGTPSRFLTRTPL